MLNREQRGKNNQISLIPIPNRHITTDVTVTLTKLDDNKNNNKSRLFSTTCSRRAQEEKNYNKRAIINNKNLSSFYLPKQKMNIKTVPAKNNNNNITLRKSPLTQLKQDLERLRQQKIDDESLIQKQTQEIMALKKKLIGTKELELQLLKKATIETKLALVNKEIKNLSIDVIDLLQVTNSSDRITNKESIEKLKTQLETQEDDFKKKLEGYTTLITEIKQNIHSHQELFNKLKLDHATQISQLNSNHIDHLNKLKLDHKQELTHLKKKKKPSCHLNNLDHILEQALLEFEQEQYNHIPTTMLIRQHDSNHKSLLHGKTIPAMMNQQWYSKKFIPVDAVSWPAPQPSPNLKIMRNHSR